MQKLNHRQFVLRVSFVITLNCERSVGDVTQAQVDI